MDHTEIESKLVICAARRRDVVREIHDLDSIAGYGLVRRAPRDIHDRYFDTADRDLSRKQLSLRVRVVDGRMLLTIKGPPEHLEGGGMARFELEEAWTAGSLATALARLRTWGIDLPEAPAETEPTPEMVLESVSLRNVHQRLVRRVVRDAVPESPRGSAPAAEIVIDAVRFAVGNRAVLHDEIEVEGRGPDSAAHVRALTSALSDHLGTCVRPWSHAKLVIGFALETLAGQDELDALLDEEGRISEDGYARVEELAGS